MEDQSHYVSSTHDAPKPDEQLYLGAEDEMDDVLDLTGGKYTHPAFAVSFPGKHAVEEDEEKPSYSDSLEPSPEDEEPSSISSDIPRFPVIPSAPVEEHDIAALPYGAPSSGSVDVNLFPLPASSAPLMQSSADNVMDLQQPSSTEPAGKEDLSSLLFESTTTLPSLSPLSADYPKEHTATIAFSADSTTPEALQSYATETDYAEGKDHKYTFGLGDIKEDTIFSDRGYAVEHPTSQPESVPVDHAKLYTQSAKEMFSGMLKSVGPPHEEFLDPKGVEHYVDFKPFVSTAGLDLGYEFKSMAAGIKSNISSLNFESTKPEEKYMEEKDIDLSDDISPASPEAISNSSSYETFAPLQKAAPLAYGGNPFTDHKFEKSVEETGTRQTSHLGSNVATVNPFLEHIDKEAEYVTSDHLSGIVFSQSSSKPEGLTPDIVQEAYESEVYEVGVPKLNYEPKIDLVQTTAKASQENTPPTQNTAPFEDSESVSSPVLPDIVMEAPLTSASQPDVSTARHVGVVSEEKIKFESEKPPSYEDAINKGNLKEQEPAAAHVEPVKKTRAEEAEAPYISIACDLIKETIPEKVTDFPKALKSEFDYHYTTQYDESSPESEPSEPSYKHWESEVILKEAATSISSVQSRDVALDEEQESDEKWNEEVSGKAYLESESRVFDTNILAKEPVTQLSRQEKPLQMEAFGKTVYAEEVPHITEPVHFEKPSAVPFVQEFVSKPSREDQVEVKKRDDRVLKDEPKKIEDLHSQQKAKESTPASVKLVDFNKKESEIEETIPKPAPPTKGADVDISSSTEKKQPPALPALGACSFKTSVVDLLYWRDIKKSGLVFGASLFMLLSLTVFSIVSVSAYIALALLSVSISLRIYKGVLQAIQKSEEGHPFRSYLDSNVAVSEELVNKYSNVALGHVNCTLKELRRLFLVEDLVDSLKFAVLMWVFTYIGALFNGLTLLILALISLFSIPVIYERHQTKVDHYIALISKNFNNVKDLILAKIPGLKRKAE
ncbi:PREDICTED: reticulon-4 isoform X2 [Nanorana parkeri]|uniref:reticulon-4 isoform X2 n=1 Tax=Nanorana parkeri TaxID=125878 RepID=UPI000854B456|nr:PREDICTED: reticulon-4 isoform X2 [Nanorana parkeri]